MNEYEKQYKSFKRDTLKDLEKTVELRPWTEMLGLSNEALNRSREVKHIKSRISHSWEDYVKGNSFAGVMFGGVSIKEKIVKHKKVIFNEPATIVIWEDGTRTVVKTCEGDTFDKTTGFLQAYFQKLSGMSKTQSSKFLRELVE